MPGDVMRPDAACRVVCIGTYGGHQGGAAIAMERLAAGLAARGARVDLLVRHPPGGGRDDDGAVQATAKILRAERHIRRRIRHGRTMVSNTLFSADWPAWDVTTTPEVAAADIIHVHWVAGFLAAESVRRLVATGKPVVWTQHDMRAFTGGCHYPAGCEGFTAACHACPQLLTRLAATAERTLARSRRRLRGLPLAFVSPSRWLAGEFARSSLYDPSHHRIDVIPNGIDLARYAPAADKAAARARLGLPPRGLAIVLGSVSLDEARKGGRQAAAALEGVARRLAAAGGAAPPPIVISYGAGSLPIRGLACRHLGRLDEPGIIAALHAGDVHLTLAREDNLPNTVVEALACGLPVVGSRVGGIPELIVHGESGWLVPPDDTAAAAEILFGLAAGRRDLPDATARRRAERFDVGLQAERHLALYRDLLGTAAPRVAGERGRPALLPPTPAVAGLVAADAPCRGIDRALRRVLRRTRS